MSDVVGVASPLFPKDIVEGMLAETLGEVKKSVDMLFFNPMNMDEDLNVKTTRHITMGFIQDALIKLATYRDKELAPKHRVCRKVLLTMSKKMEDNPVNSNKRHFDKVRFGINVTDFLSAFHICLAEHSKPAERSAALKRFTGRGRV